MEELQDAIEDAQYVNAIATQDEGPRPILAWEFPEEEVVSKWEEEKKAKETDSFEFEWTLKEPIGYFLFSSFVKEEQNDYVRMNFCEEVLRFRKLQGKPRYKKAREICKGYMTPPKEIEDGQETPVHEEVEKQKSGVPNTFDIVEESLGGGSKKKNKKDGGGGKENAGPSDEGAKKMDQKDLSSATATTSSEDNAGGGATSTAPNTISTTTTSSTSGTGDDGASQQKSQKKRKHLPHKKSEITEYDLARTSITNNDILLGLKGPALFSQNMDHPACSQSSAGLCGPIYKELIDNFNEMETLYKIVPNSLMMQEATATNIIYIPKDKQQQIDEENHQFLKSMMKSADSSSTVTGSESFPLKVASKDQHRQDSIQEDKEDSTKEDKQDDKKEDKQDDKKDDKKEVPLSASEPKPLDALQRSQSITHAPTYRDMSAYKSTSESVLETRTSNSDTVPGNAVMQHKARFDTLLGDIFVKAEILVMESLRRDYWDLFIKSDRFVKLKNFLWYRDRPVVPEDFFVLRPLGRGGFGLVTAVKKGTSGKLYAMKTMNKRRIKMKQSEKLALNERQALAAVESNFVCNLKYSFHNKEEIFLVLDLMTGGDLGYHLQKKGRFPKRECLYYAARIMLGLQAMHENRYVYRDLKPENCLLADDGRVKITDLGLATKITPNLHGAAGTRGYWAPEMLQRDAKGKRINYGHAVDWFSFGCCIAEFISGSNPFRSEAALNFGLEHGKQTKEKAIDCATLEMEPEFPADRYEPDAADLCRRLLDKNVKTRLGYNGCKEIMAHSWFEKVRWEDIILDRKDPPFIPPTDVNAISQQEIGNFAEDKAYQETVITPQDEHYYSHWDWTNPRAFASEVIEFLIYERETGQPLLPVAQHGTCCCNVL